jgi:hypothetical protein
LLQNFDGEELHQFQIEEAKEVQVQTEKPTTVTFDRFVKEKNLRKCHHHAFAKKVSNQQKHYEVLS